MTYPGGKGGGGVYQTIINQIPPHDVYIEPFLGGGAVMRHKRPAARSCGVELADFVEGRGASEGRGARGEGRDSAASAADAGLFGGIPNLELYQCDGVEWLRHHFGLYRVRGEGRGARGEKMRPQLLAPDNAATAAAAGSGDADVGDCARATFVYADPPYPLGCRRSGEIYEFEMTDDQHAALVEVLLALPCYVMVSSYSNELYEDAFEQWRRLEFQAMTRGGSMATEVLWMNYPGPVELHDYRYVGRDKRHREKVRRRIRNWVNGAKRLPAVERLALLDAMRGVDTVD